MAASMEGTSIFGMKYTLMKPIQRAVWEIDHPFVREVQDPTSPDVKAVKLDRGKPMAGDAAQAARRPSPSFRISDHSHGYESAELHAVRSPSE